MVQCEKEIGAIQARIEEVHGRIEKMRKKYENHPEFATYEAHHSDGIDLARLTYSEMRRLRSDLQLIFQDPYSSLNPRMTVGQIIGEGMIAHKYFRRNDDRMKEEIVRVMEECGLAPYFLHRYPHQFSGGQRRDWHCPFPGSAAEVRGLRRGGFRFGRVHPGTDHQPPPGAEGEATPHLYVHHP